MQAVRLCRRCGFAGGGQGAPGVTGLVFRPEKILDFKFSMKQKSTENVGLKYFEKKKFYDEALWGRKLGHRRCCLI